MSSANFNSRLGVKKIFLLDNDVVDITNLNRQLLFSQDDVGRRKVDAATNGLKHHIIDTGRLLHYPVFYPLL